MEKKYETKNIVLVGLMGAGKTKVGRMLSRRLGLGFVDTDREIESRTGVNISTIFEIEGEEGFRKREARIIKELTVLNGHVLATGGGVILREENRKNLQKNGFVVYLNAPPHVLWERTRNDKNRPLLKVKDPLQKLQELFVSRHPLYQEVADFVVNERRGNIRSVVQLLVKEVSERWNR